MLEKLTVLTMASAMARHAAARHRVIAENVANADTPGYRARDLKPFAEMVNEAFTPRATRPGHLGARDALGRLRLVAGTVEAPVSPNGNGVSLEEQSLRAVETQSAHDLAMAVYRKSVDLLRIGLGRNR